MLQATTILMSNGIRNKIACWQIIVTNRNNKGKIFFFAATQFETTIAIGFVVVAWGHEKYTRDLNVANWNS